MSKKTLKQAVTRSWKTTAAGVIQFIIVLLTQSQTLLDTSLDTNPDWSLIVTSAVALYGFLTARDSDVSSEDSGIEPKPRPVPDSPAVNEK